MTPPPSLIHNNMVHKNTPPLFWSLFASPNYRVATRSQNANVQPLAWPAEQSVPNQERLLAHRLILCLPVRSVLRRFYFPPFSLGTLLPSTVPRDDNSLTYTSEQPQHKGCKSFVNVKPKAANQRRPHFWVRLVFLLHARAQQQQHGIADDYIKRHTR